MNKKERIEQAFPGITQAVKDFNGWSLSASIMIDLSDRSIWFDGFISDYDYKVYHDSRVVKVLGKSATWGPFTEISVNNIISAMADEYWISDKVAMRNVTMEQQQVNIDLAEDIQKIAKELLLTVIC